MSTQRRPREESESAGEMIAAEGLIQASEKRVPGDDEPPLATAVYLSPDNEHLAVVSEYKNLALYRLNGEAISVRLAERRVASFSRVSWSKSGKMLAFVNRRQAELLYVPSGKTEYFGPASAVAFYPDSSRLAVLSGTWLTIWNIEPSTVLRRLELPGQSVKGSDAKNLHYTLDISPDGRLLAYGTESGTVQVLDARDLDVVHTLAHTEIITDLEWIGESTLASASLDHTIRVWSFSDSRFPKILETEESMLGLSYSPELNCIAGWTHENCFMWSMNSGKILYKDPLPIFANIGYRYISFSPGSDLMVRLNGPETSDIAFFRSLGTDLSRQAVSVSTYANAKVLMLGDSGVGKSGLGMVLAGEPFEPTESTHARRIWKMPVPELDVGTGAQREVLLWDLAGQPGYRIVHQLHLSEGTVGLIVFDSRSETSPLAGVGYWARALRHAQGARSDKMPAYLVGARTDRGVVGVSDERIAEVVAEFGFRNYLATSAKENWGIAELRAAVLAVIDWSSIPVVTSSALFAAAKSFVLDQKQAGTLLTPLASLLASFLGAPVTGPAAQAAPGAKTGRDLLNSGSGNDEHNRLRGVFDGCVARLESAGLVKRLAFGDLVLLQPELIDVYAGAIVNAARDEPDGLGSMLESRVLEVDFRLPEQERITDRQQEKLLVIATLEELTRYEIVLREVTEDGIQLVFPAAFRRDLPEAAESHDNAVEFLFEGPVANIYVTLVVRLARSDRFTRRGTFQSAMQFEADAGGVCTVHLTRSDEGRGALQVGYSERAADVARFQFERFVLAHLERRATAGTVRRVRLYRCPDCDSPFNARQVEAAVSRGRTSLLCPADETRIPLEGSFERMSRAQDAAAREMDASADAARSIAAASSVILGKEETTDFDVFLCHNGDDKPDVRWTAQQLRQRSILPWLDEDELIPGRPWQEELERQIGHIRAAAVFVGPSGIGPWQNQEMRAFLSEFAERRCPVIPVILPGAAVPALPVFLRPMTWVDLRTRSTAKIDRLIWGITGRKPGLSGLDGSLE